MFLVKWFELLYVYVLFFVYLFMFFGFGLFFICDKTGVSCESLLS